MCGSRPLLFAGFEDESLRSLRDERDCQPPVCRVEIDGVNPLGVTTVEAQSNSQLEREVKELRRANEMLMTNGWFSVAAELDRKLECAR